jgi:hypothetical protein
MGCPTEVEIGDNLVFSVCTHDPDTGVLTDADSMPTYRIYEDETATPILTGSMTKLDDANTTGFYTEGIACTSGNGFENGKTYTIYIVATVDSDQGAICFSFKAYDHRKANVKQISDDGTAADDLELLVENSKGTDNKVLISTDAQDLSGSLDVNTKLIEGSDATDQIRDAVVDDATKIDASALNILSGHAPDNTIADVDNIPSAASVSDAVWDEAASGHTTGGSFGDKLQSKVPSGSINDYKADVSNLDVTVSSRSSHSAADVWGVATRTLTSFGTLITDIWHHLASAITQSGSIGKQVKDSLDVTVSSRSDFDESTDKVTLTDATETQIDNIETDTNELQGLISDSKIAAQVKGADADTINASALATDAVNEIRDAVMDKVIDGSIDLEEVLKITLAVLAGDMAKSENTYTYKDQSDNTKVTAVVSDSAVERTIGG